MVETVLTGKIRAHGLAEGNLGRVTGEEDWEVTLHADGLRALRSRGRVLDEPMVLRDVLQSVDSDFHPHDAFARIVVGGRLRGSAWYHFTDTVASCEALTANEGRISQTFPIRRGIRGFGTHALQSDGWLTAGYDLSKGPGVQYFTNNLMTTTDHRGATGPMFMTTTSGLEYAGDETVEVGAGTFACHHFRFVGTSHAYPPFDVWVSADGHYTFVKAMLGGSRAQAFELVEYGAS